MRGSGDRIAQLVTVARWLIARLWRMWLQPRAHSSATATAITLYLIVESLWGSPRGAVPANRLAVHSRAAGSSLKGAPGCYKARSSSQISAMTEEFNTSKKLFLINPNHYKWDEFVWRHMTLACSRHYCLIDSSHPFLSYYNW